MCPGSLYKCQFFANATHKRVSKEGVNLLFIVVIRGNFVPACVYVVVEQFLSLATATDGGYAIDDVVFLGTVLDKITGRCGYCLRGIHRHC